MPTELRAVHEPTTLDPARWLANDTFAVYLFHGVIDQHIEPVRNYTRKHISTELFRQILESLSEDGSPVSMDRIVDHHATGDPLPPKAFAITFDDGFENNCSVAAGVLQEYAIPATFYVTTDFVENNSMSWIDRIERCFDHTQRASIRLRWNDEPSSFANSHQKIALLEIIRANIKTDPGIDVDEFVADICRQCEMSEVRSSNDPLDQKMSWPQVRELDNHDLFTIGGHSHTHPTLAFLSQDELDEEIQRSLQLLEVRAGVRNRHYSYPEGHRQSYSANVIDTLRRYGVECCPTAELGVNSIDDDLFHLRRIPVTR